MNVEELVCRVKERFFEYFNSDNRAIRLISRLLAFGLFAAVISTLAPTLADELSSSPSMQQPVQPPTPDSSTATVIYETPTATASPTPSPEPTIARPTISSASQSPLADPSDSLTVIDEPPAPLEIQPKYSLQIPSTVAVDPRATSAFLPHINAYSDKAEYTMACIHGSGLTLDILTKKASTTAPMGPDFLIGDRSNYILVSGTTERVVALINSYSGLFAESSGRGIAGTAITFNFVAVTKPVLNVDFCAESKAQASTIFRPLGLIESTVKGGGRLK